MWVGRIRKKHIFFNPNIRRIKSWEKYKKALNWFVLLAKKEKKEGLTKRIQKTRVRCLSRIKKYGISNTILKKELKLRWL